MPGIETAFECTIPSTFLVSLSRFAIARTGAAVLMSILLSSGHVLTLQFLYYISFEYL